MSVVDERSALDPPVSLLEHAQRLHQLSPDGPLPRAGWPYPGGADDRPKVPYPERQIATAAVIQTFLGNPALSAQDLHDQCAQLAVRQSDVIRIIDKISPTPSTRLLEAARWLIRNGTDRRAVLIGLGLLSGNAGHDDISPIKTIGLLGFADQLAAKTLAEVPGTEHDLIWLANRSRAHVRTYVVRELAGNPDPGIRDWVCSTPRELLSSELARHIAEQHRLPELLSQEIVDDARWDQTGNLLLAMSSSYDGETEISRYQSARDVYRRWIAGAPSRKPSLERAALLTMAAEDLLTGPAALLVGEDRADLIAGATDVLASLAWTAMLDRCAESADAVEARRAVWVKDGIRRGHSLGKRFAIRVFVPDPKRVGFPQVETRILIDGMPIIAAAFNKGPAEQPEHLVHGGQLRATNVPRQVRLAEASCTEGCCGALYVTIVREGPVVVWKDWRSSMRGDPPPEIRFDAADYDREVSRAQHDYGWEWPARTLARFVTGRLRADPATLGRWDCKLNWCTAWLKDLNTARLVFVHPASWDSPSDPFIQFGLVIDIQQGETPESAAARIIEFLQNTDPKTTAEMIGGSKQSAGKLGLRYRKPTRW